MPPAHQQQKRLLLLLKRGRWPYYAAIILIACGYGICGSTERGPIDRILEGLMVRRGFG